MIKRSEQVALNRYQQQLLLTSVSFACACLTVFLLQRYFWPVKFSEISLFLIGPCLVLSFLFQALFEHFFAGIVLSSENCFKLKSAIGLCGVDYF